MSLHTLWGKARTHPDYDKAEWIALQDEIEALRLRARPRQREGGAIAVIQIEFYCEQCNRICWMAQPPTVKDAVEVLISLWNPAAGEKPPAILCAHCERVRAMKEAEA